MRATTRADDEVETDKGDNYNDDRALQQILFLHYSTKKTSLGALLLLLLINTSDC